MTKNLPADVICTSVGVYSDALTRGRCYRVIDHDESKQQVRVKTDRGRMRWFPLYHFDFDTSPLVTLKSFTVDDPIEDDSFVFIEVSLEFSDGEKRWCCFTTPARLTRAGSRVKGTQVHIHYPNRHLIIASELSEEGIGRILQRLDSENMLFECSLLLDKELADSDEA